MAIKTIKLDDATLAKYELMDPKQPLKALETQLKRFEDHPIQKRILILRDDIREAVEKLYGKAVEEDQDKFLAWLSKLVEARIGEAALPLSEGQTKRLMAESLHRHRPVHELMQEKLKWAMTHAFGY